MTLKLVRPLAEAALSEKITALDELVRDIETAHDVPALRQRFSTCAFCFALSLP